MVLPKKPAAVMAGEPEVRAEGVELKVKIGEIMSTFDPEVVLPS